MEIKAELNKPYIEQERINFIVENNHQKGYLIQETDNALLALGPDANEQRLSEIELELSQAETDYTTQLDTAVPYATSEDEEGNKTCHMYKPKWAEETYISLLTAGQLMPDMFPMTIWDATELEENAVEMTLAELTKLTLYLANIQQQYFNQRKAKKSALLEEKAQLLQPTTSETEEPPVAEETPTEETQQ